VTLSASPWTLPALRVSTEAKRMNEAIADRQNYACDLARHAGAPALDFFERRETLAVETKATAQDVVSHADRAIEALIR